MRATEALFLSNPENSLDGVNINKCTHIKTDKKALKMIKEARSTNRLSQQAGYELFQQRQHLASIKQEILQTA